MPAEWLRLEEARSCSGENLADNNDDDVLISSPWDLGKIQFKARHSK